MGAALASQPEALALVLKAAGDTEREVREAALRVLGDWDIDALLSAWYTAQTTTRRRGFTRTLDPLLSALLCKIRRTFPTLSWVGHTVCWVEGSRSERYPLTTPEQVRPLFHAIKSDWARYGFPRLSFMEATGEKRLLTLLRRTVSEKPEFKAALPLALHTGLTRRQSVRISVPEEKSNRPALLRLDTSGGITLNFTVPYRDLVFGKELGKGGYGAVYQGQYQFETVAIKRFFLEDFSPERQQEIRHEASVMAALQSDHLVKLRGICLEQPHYCVVMEYLPGGDLYHLLKNKSQPLSWAQRYRLALDICIGLYHLHEQQILHRDLKSLNVLLYEANGERRGKLSDFGLATLRQPTSDKSEAFAGSLFWADPQVIQGAPASKASDVYSLGMVLYELVSREPPFIQIKTDLKGYILAGNLPELPPDCPKALAELIRACWDPDPKARPAVRVVAQRLEALYQAALTIPTEAKAKIPLIASTEKYTTQTPGLPGGPPLLLQQLSPMGSDLLPPERSLMLLQPLREAPAQTPVAQPLKEDSPPNDPHPASPVSSVPPTPSPARVSRAARYTLFAATLPVAFKESKDQPEKEAALRQKIRSVLKEHGYHFGVQRIASTVNRLVSGMPQAEDALIIRFTAQDEVLETAEEIKQQLFATAKLLQELIKSHGIDCKPAWFKPDWQQWTLTLHANSDSELNAMAALLKRVSGDYLQLETDRDPDPTAACCRVQ